VSQPCTVLISAPEFIEALKGRTAAPGTEIVAFTDSEALRALETITRRKPQIVALERLFAASPRGAALINRIKADPSLSGCGIRVVALDPEQPRALQESPAPEPENPYDPPLDPAGTRSTPRFAIAGPIEIMIDKSPATLVDLSAGGAQVLSPTVLKPNQRVRLTFSDAAGDVRVNASVAWATFEIPPRYRAGIEFIDADERALQAFAQRHQA
jgi:hypothetical protein